MKHLKKVITLVLAVATAFALATPALAADGDDQTSTETPAAEAKEYDAPVTVKGLAKDDVAHFYQIIKWDPTNANNVSGWVAATGFESILDKETLTEVLVGTKADPDANPPVEGKDPTGITAELAGQLARAAKDLKSDDVTVKDTSAVHENTAPGTWMAIITPADADTVYNPVFVSGDYKKGGNEWSVTEAASYSDEAAAKKSTVGLTKTAKTEEDTWDDAKWTTTAIGDTVQFTVETTIPGYGDVYTNPFFKISDKLADLKLVAKSVKITEPAAAAATIEEASDGKSYTITFDKDYLKTVKTPTKVTVTYSAIVTTDAPIFVNTEKNEVSTEFSHNPTDESDHGFKKDTTQHYTFTLDADGIGSGDSAEGKKTSELVKVGVKADGTPINKTEVRISDITKTNTWTSPLEGAEFKLYTDATCTTEYVPKTADGKTGTALEIKTNADGRMTIKGLDAGTYYLREEKAPAGFVKDSTAHKIHIEAKTSEKKITEYTTDGQNWISEEDYNKLTDDDKKPYKSYTYKTETLDSYTVTVDDKHTAASYHFENKGTDSEIKWTEEPPVELPFQIKNTQGTELPSTGGMGTRILYTIGGIMVVAGGVFLAAKKRMSTIEE